MKKFIFTTLCILCASNLFCEDAVKFINCSWTEESGNMILHLELDINGQKNKPLSVNAYFHNADGTKLKDTNGRYKTTDGQVATQVDIKPIYDSSHWSDLTLSIPVYELHPLPGENSYYVDFVVYDGDYSLGRISNACSYKLTGKSSDNYSTSGHNHSSSNASTCTICKGSGTTVCVICNGTGNDPVPKPIINHFTHQITYQYVKCMMCGGKGRKTCALCNGTGVLVNPNLPVTGSDPNYSVPDFNSSSSSSRTTCSRCGGSGICHGCGGRKGSWEYIDHYTGDGKKGYIPCGECRGSGKCPICYGRGKL